MERKEIEGSAFAGSLRGLRPNWPTWRGIYKTHNRQKGSLANENFFPGFSQLFDRFRTLALDFSLEGWAGTHTKRSPNAPTRPSRADGNLDGGLRASGFPSARE